MVSIGKMGMNVHRRFMPMRMGVLGTRRNRDVMLVLVVLIPTLFLVKPDFPEVLPEAVRRPMLTIHIVTALLGVSVFAIAALVAFIEQANPNAGIIMGGDLNVYPRPDDPFAPIGKPGSSDQLGALYAPALGLTNLWDVLLGQAPEAAYSYVYLGMAQTLDQMFVNQAMLTGESMPVKKEKESQAIRRIVELRGMKWNVQPG